MFISYSFSYFIMTAKLHSFLLDLRNVFNVMAIVLSTQTLGFKYVVSSAVLNSFKIVFRRTAFKLLDQRPLCKCHSKNPFIKWGTVILD